MTCGPLSKARSRLRERDPLVGPRIFTVMPRDCARILQRSGEVMSGFPPARAHERRGVEAALQQVSVLCRAEGSERTRQVPSRSAVPSRDRPSHGSRGQAIPDDGAGQLVPDKGPCP